MTLDTSAYCPGGTGKKIKHCMCRDISGELTQIMRALEGNQRAAAVERINRALATNAHRPCLLAMKIITLLDMNDLQNLEDTVTTFVKVAPDNALAHTFAAMLELRKDRTSQAVDSVQTAISLATDSFPGELYDALAAVAHSLANEGRYLAARGHLLFRAMIGGNDDEATRSLMSISAAEGIPLLLKRDLVFDSSAPDNAPWKREFTAACELCTRGAWKAALEALEKLNEQYPNESAILRNIATARSYLGNVGSAEAWHAYAKLDDIDPGLALLAEATAQLLEHEATLKTVGFVKITLKVTDANDLQEKMLSSNLIVPSPLDPAQLREGDAPPPKAVFQILDRPTPASDAELTPENLPRVLCQALLFGRETDRDARLEIAVAKNQQYESARKTITEVADGLISADGETEEVLDTISVQMVEMFPSLWFPRDATFAQRKPLTDQVTRAAFQEKWPELPLTALDDKSPAEVAGDETYKLRLTAALLVLEQLAEVNSWPVDVDQLRERLGIPAPERIDLQQVDVTALRPDQWHLVEPDKLDDEMLTRLYVQAVIYRARRALLRLGEEVLKREHLSDSFDVAAVAGELAQASGDPDVSLKWLARARSLAEQKGGSPARWYLSELPLRLLRGESAEVQHIMTVLQTRHIREPGIAEGLYQILVRFGVITPDGRMAGQEEAAAAPAGPDADPNSQLWTPDAAQAPAGEKRESKIWVPGMD